MHVFAHSSVTLVMAVAYRTFWPLYVSPSIMSNFERRIGYQHIYVNGSEMKLCSRVSAPGVIGCLIDPS